VRRHGERGSTLIEMAFAAASALMLILGIMELGRAYYTYGFVAQLARDGARWAMVRGSMSCTNSGSKLNDCDATPAEIQSYVQSLSEGATVPADITVTTTYPSCGTNAPGCTVSVNVSYPFQYIDRYMPRSVITMSSASQMVIAQ
jgi:Flp pilus assembly protein TadG